MCCNDIRCHIICRMLHRCKRINILAQRKYDNTSRMLTGTSADTGTSLHDPVNFTVSLSLTSLLVIVFHITECRLVRQRSYGSGTVSLPRSEDNFCVLMRITLIISREVQVNIRFFISFKPKERLKRNIESILYKRLSAHRTSLIRHIPSTASGICPNLFRFKVTVMAFLTVIMRA